MFARPPAPILPGGGGHRPAILSVNAANVICSPGWGTQGAILFFLVGERASHALAFMGCTQKPGSEIKGSKRLYRFDCRAEEGVSRNGRPRLRPL